jgi:hypothetical protein
MASTLQSAAARINGAQSQGPVTPEGKAVSSQNSLRHGMCSKQVVLPGEDPQEFERHRASYLQHYHPLTQPEIDQVEIIASTCWRLRRMMAFESALLSGEDTDPLKALSLLIRYENQLNRTRDQAEKYLKALQENRPQTANSAPQRNEPEQTPERSPEQSEQDRKNAIRAAMAIAMARAEPKTPEPTGEKPAA